MKATCPKNENHKKFVTTAHEAHTWIVNEYGEFVKDLGSDDIDEGPSIYNIWTCCICGERAIVTGE